MIKFNTKVLDCFDSNSNLMYYIVIKSIRMYPSMSGVVSGIGYYGIDTSLDDFLLDRIPEDPGNEGDHEFRFLIVDRF